MHCTISHCDTKGRGIGATEKGAVAIPFTVPGDVVRVAPRGKRHGVHIGAMEEIVTPSPDRMTPRCPYAGRCGGCPWQMFDYTAQLRCKHETVAAALASFQCEIPPVLHSPEQYYYRNRMDYAFGVDGSLGLREPGSWSRVIDLSTCFLLSEDGVRCMEAVRTWAHAHHVPPWDARTHTGFLRYLVLREGKRTGDRLAILITAPGDLPAREDLIAHLSPITTGILWGVNPSVADVSHAAQYETLWGRAEVREVLHSKPRNHSPSQLLNFHIPPNAFFQTNTLAAEILIATVREFAALSPADTLVDLYCGVGTFAIALARDARRVIGVESQRSAIEAARRNAATNSVTNATFHVIAAESWPFPIEPVDCLVMDPPRAGLHPKTLEKVLRHAPQRIVYVSCNPCALARDLRALLSPSAGGESSPQATAPACWCAGRHERGDVESVRPQSPTGGGAYRIERIQPIDLFPNSYHVETVVLLQHL